MEIESRHWWRWITMRFVEVRGRTAEATRVVGTNFMRVLLTPLESPNQEMPSDRSSEIE